MELNQQDVVIQTFRTGSGWFSKDNGVRLTHIPSGITCSSSSERSQHANRAKAWDELDALISKTTKTMLNNMTKPTIELTYKQLRDRITTVLGSAINSRNVVTWECWPGSVVLANHIVQDLGKILEFGKGKIARGSKVKVVAGFSVGSSGVVEFVEPLPGGKIWVTRNGDSGPKYWYEHELEIVE